MPIEGESKSEIFEQECEFTNLYRIGNPKAPIKVVASMRDNGEVNVLSPIVRELIKNTNYQVFVFADGPGKKYLQKNPDFEKLKIRENILIDIADKVDEADLVLVSQSVNSAIDESLTATSITKNGIRPIVLAIEDFPGGGNGYDNVLSSKNPLLVPDWQCVMNEQSKRALMRTRPEIDPDRIVVTGLPSFDNIDANKKKKIRKEFRNKYNIEDNKKVIVWIGGYDVADRDSFKIFIDGLKDVGLKDYALIIRRHPRDESEDAFFSNTTADLTHHLVDTTSENMDAVRQAADLTVSVCSTEAIKAVCEETPTLLIMIPEILKQIGMENFSLLIGEDGSAAVVRKKTEMVGKLRKSLFDELYKEEMKEKMKNWEVDGKATERIIDLISDLFHK